MGFNGDLYPTAGASVVMNTKGDMVDYDTARQRLAIGSANQILQVKSSLPSWETVDLADTVLTTAGDVLYENATPELARLGAGTQYFNLQMGASLPAWSASSSSVLSASGDVLYASGANTLAKLAKATDGDTLQLASGVPAWVTVSAGAGETFARVVKKANETITSDTTLTDDSELVVALSADKTYGFILNFFFKTEAATDIKITFTAPTGADGDFNTVRNIVGGYPINNKTFTTTVAFDGTGGNSWAFVFGKVDVSTTAGNLALQWAQNTSGGSNTIVNSGSTLVVWEETA